MKFKIKFLEPNTLEMYGESLKDKFLKVPKEYIESSYIYIIEKQYKNLEFKKTIISILFPTFFISAIASCAAVPTLYYADFRPFAYFILTFMLFTYFIALLFNRKLPITTVEDCETLLKILKNNPELFEKTNYSTEDLTSAIDDFISSIKQDFNESYSGSDKFDTITIILLIDILNKINKIPNFNSPDAAKLVRKITGCSITNFRKNISVEHYKKDSIKSKKILYCKLMKIRDALNEIGFKDANEHIDKLINHIGLDMAT